MSETITVAAQLDGTIQSVVREISRLHGEILAEARTSLTKAIRIGELLCRVRDSRKGKWLAWLKDNVPFSDQTARNYIRCFDRRADLEFKNVLNLSDAYAFLCTPKKPDGPEAEAKEGKKSFCDLREISPRRLNAQLRRAQIEIDKFFTEWIDQIRRQDRVEWSEFCDRLLEHGKQLIEQARRLCPGNGSE